MKKYVYKFNERNNTRLLLKNGGVIFSIDGDIISNNDFLKLSIMHGLKDEQAGEQVEVWDESLTNDCVCANCGSRNVETKSFTNFLTGIVGGETGDDEDHWCNDCETHGEFLTELTTEPLLIHKTKV